MLVLVMAADDVGMRVVGQVDDDLRVLPIVLLAVVAQHRILARLLLDVKLPQFGCCRIYVVEKGIISPSFVEFVGG